MNEHIIKYLTNSVTSKLLSELERQPEMTAKQLATKYNDIPQATLYRYLNRMRKDGVIQVVRENKVRAVYEKVYALSPDYTNDMNDALEGDSGELYLKFFMQFAKGLIKEFQDYASSEGEKEKRDCGGFFINPVYATDEEVTEIYQQFINRIEKLGENDPSPERKLRNMAMIITPTRLH